uniref:Uncharacterized protein n=1 Tax=Amphimedon queenslandica TaxID=400682 RepID=A0A1X7SQW2_AMPQE
MYKRNAISFQHKTVIMYERLLGVDHCSSISAYYCCGAEKNVVALRLLYRVMYLIMLTLGEDHPEMSNVDFYIGLLLSNAGHYEESQEYLESARRLQNKFHGSQSITVATIHHLLANSLTHIGAFAEAKQNKRKAYNIYRTKVCSNVN